VFSETVLFLGSVDACLDVVLKIIIKQQQQQQQKKTIGHQTIANASQLSIVFVVLLNTFPPFFDSPHSMTLFA